MATTKVKIFCDAYLFCLGKERKDVGNALNNADVQYADGRSVRILTGWHYCTGSDYFERVLRASRESGSVHYFYGGTQTMLENLTTAVRDKYGAAIAGSFSPPMTKELSWPVESAVLDVLEKRPVDYFWVFLGGGKQEVWADQNRDKLPVREVLCVGAVLRFYSGAEKRAPRAFRNLGLEWLYRTIVADAPRAKRNLRYLLKMSGHLVRHGLRRIFRNS